MVEEEGVPITAVDHIHEANQVRDTERRSVELQRCVLDAENISNNRAEAQRARSQ